MRQRLRNYLCAISPSQNARAVTCIKPALDGDRESLVIFEFGLSAPRLKMQTQPGFTLRFPLIAQTLRDRIGQSKCDEINCALLLPMRQAIHRETNLAIWVEEAKCAHQLERNSRRMRAMREGMSLVQLDVSCINRP